MHGMKLGGGRMAVAILALLFLAAGSGCSLYSGVMPLPPTGSSQTVFLDVPFHPQEEYQCGPAALAMALSWSGLPVQPQTLTDKVYTPARKGSLQPDMITATRRFGRIAYPIKGATQLMAELAGGHPVIVLQNLGLSWYPVWHYAVAIGYDYQAGEIILHSGRIPLKRSPFRVFENTWGASDFWGLLVLSPSTMPVTVEKTAWLDAAVGLEHAGSTKAAVTAYTVATTKWPASHDAWIGLGNTRYATGDKPGAVVAFRRAAEVKPNSGIAFNNLAQVLLELGRRSEALGAAKKAVACGGPYVETFKKTLSEIQR